MNRRRAITRPFSQRAYTPTSSGPCVARQGVCDLPSSRLERWPDEEGSANGALDGDGGSFTAAGAQRNCQDY
jgi:hypothetical protein